MVGTHIICGIFLSEIFDQNLIMKKQTNSEYGIHLRINAFTFQKLNQRREEGNGTSPD